MTDHSLEYVTVDSIQWATGHIRPRMALEEKRAKHRVHQRQFMLRQRERIEQLQRDMRRYTLQLQLMEATRETATLVAENEAMKQQLQCRDATLTTTQEKMPFQVFCQDTSSEMASAMVEKDDEAAILELLDMLPDVDTLHVDSPSDIAASAWCQNVEMEPLAWPSSPSCATSFLELLG